MVGLCRKASDPRAGAVAIQAGGKRRRQFGLGLGVVTKGLPPGRGGLQIAHPDPDFIQAASGKCIVACGSDVYGVNGHFTCYPKENDIMLQQIRLPTQQKSLHEVA
jgi:hypothetical protein